MSTVYARPRGLWLVLISAAGVIATGAVLWLFGVAVAGVVLSVQSKTAQDHLDEAMRSATAGDAIRAAAEAQSAINWLSSARRTAAQPSIQSISVVSPSIAADIDSLLGAFASLSSAAQDGIGLLQTLKGSQTAPAAFEGGRFDLAQLPKMAPAIDSMNSQLAAAQVQLERVGSTPGMADIRDEALETVDPARELLSAVSAMFPQLPDALGAYGTKRYLVTVLNPAELNATGGPPLSAMILQLENGKMSIPISGQVSTKIFPSPSIDKIPYVTWPHLVGEPIFKSKNVKSVFVNSNGNPDFTYSGEEMARAWAAGGRGKVDGVITVDPSAIAAVIANTGPIVLPDGSELTEQNLGKRLLIDGYQDTQTAQTVAVRHAENDALMDQISARLQSSEELPGVLSALISSGPSRHFQVYMRDPQLQAEVIRLGLDGGLSLTDKDYFSVFTQASANKVAVFQDRTINRDVRLAADGSARITEVIKVQNGAEAEAAMAIVSKFPNSKLKAGTGWGYNDKRAMNEYLVYVPNQAVDPQMKITSGTPDVKPRVREFGNVNGRRMMWGFSGADPGQTVVVTVTYALPPGTFSAPNGGLTYVGWVDPQPMWQTPNLYTSVTPPPGYSWVAGDGWDRDAASFVNQTLVDKPREFILAFEPDSNGVGS